MNNDTLKGQWHQLKGKIKQNWSKLTDDDMLKAEGKSEELVGRLQERYGYSKEKAQQEWKKFCDGCDKKSASALGN